MAWVSLGERWASFNFARYPPYLFRAVLAPRNVGRARSWRMWLFALPFPRLGSRSSVNARMLFGAQQPVQLEQLTLGLGSVVAGGVHMPCQHSAFALPRAVPAAPLVLAEPLDATSPLLNAAELAGAAVLIRRGGCTFEEKLRRAVRAARDRTPKP